jgi:hypothetical protein
MGIISRGIVFNYMHLIYSVFFLTILLAVRSKTWVCGRSCAGIAGSKRDGLITRPEKSYRTWYVCVLESSTMGRFSPIRAVEPWKKKNYILFKESKASWRVPGQLYFSMLIAGHQIAYLLRTETVNC